MIILISGSSVTLNIATLNGFTVSGSNGATVLINGVTTTVDGTTVFGPYAAATTAVITAVNGDCSYGLTFPESGEVGKTYINNVTGCSYRWDADTAGYVALGWNADRTALVDPVSGRLFSLDMLGTNSDPAPLGETLHTFSAITGLTGTGTQTFAVSSEITWRGQPTVKLDVAAGVTGGVILTGLAVPLRNKTLTLAVYVPDYTAVKKLQPFLSQGAALAPDYVQYPSYTPSVAGQRNYNGWHLIDVTADMFTTVGAGVTEDGTTVKVLRLDLQAEAAAAATVYIGAAYVNLRNRPRIFLTFDDSRRSIINNAFPITQKYNIPCTAYIIPPRLGVSGITDYFTEADAETLHAANWCIANHAFNEVGTADSYSEIGLEAYMTQVLACKSWLDSRGFRGGAHHAYVEGAYDGVLVAAMENAGMQTARTIAGSVTTGAQGEIHSLGRHRYMNLNGGLQLNNTQTVANHITEIDRAIRDGRDLFIMAHDIFTAGEGGATATAGTTADLDTLCAHLADLRAKGQCDLLPVDRF